MNPGFFKEIRNLKGRSTASVPCVVVGLDFLTSLSVTLQKLASDPRCKGMPLSSFLLKPMQRITRYPLLIRSVSAHWDRGRTQPGPQSQKSGSHLPRGPTPLSDEPGTECACACVRACVCMNTIQSEGLNP